MEELNAEQLQQLEERLYSQVHHSFDDKSTNSPFVEQIMHEATAETTSNIGKFLAKRYWTSNNKNPNGIQQLQQQNAPTSNDAKYKIPDKTSKSNNNMKRIQPQHQQQNPKTVRFDNPTKQTNTNNCQQNNKQLRNPFAKPQNFNNRNNNNKKSNPLAEKLQKIQRVSQYHNKKQKANNARAKMLANPKVVATINLDLDSDSNANGDENGDDCDEVIIVPLPPTPIVSIDDSDDDDGNDGKLPATVSTTTQQQNTFQAKSQTNSSEVITEIASRCTSPASVLSHDDFIGQCDRHRLLMVNNTNSTDSFLEEEMPTSKSTRTQQLKRKSAVDDEEDIECIGTFIKPTTSTFSSKEIVGAGKRDYSVGGTEFRAIDVYESESDIVSDGVYSKGVNKMQSANATIQINLAKSDDDVDDISQNPTKTKRLRKRRASTNLRSSESNCGAESSDSDYENDGVTETGVPFIYRGQALESQKSKTKRKRLASAVSTGRMSDTEFVATLNSLAKGDDYKPKENNESESEGSDTRENIPTARDIAERVLSENLQTGAPEDQVEVIEVPCSSIRSNTEAIPAQIADDVERLLSKINEFNAKKAKEEEEAVLSDLEIVEHFNISTEPHILAASDESTSPLDVDTNENANSSKIKYFTGYGSSNTQCISDGCGWNEEMRRFYNFSWGGENFREDVILRTMKRSPHLWRISNIDRFPNIVPRGKREKCLNCLSFGHSRAKCQKPKRPLVCYMCGESGHLEARCPNTRCLRCGGQTMSFVPSCKKCMYWNNRICPICKLRGHSLNDCPDKWRRYHSTTKPNEFPVSTVVYNRRRYCCFCGMRGHLSDECRKAHHRTEYPIIASEVKSHEKSYDDVFLTKSYSEPGIKCRLLYDPKLNVNFTLAEKTTRSQMYGRFLNAVGLGKLIGVKNFNAKQNVNSSNVKNSTPVKHSTAIETVQSSTSTSAKVQQNLANKLKNQTTAIVAKEEASTSRLKMPPPPIPHILPTPMDFDSDSNYSFSEHFEVSSSLDQQLEQTETEAVERTQPLKTNSAPLPDFISLDGGGNRYKISSDVTQAEEPLTQDVGISSQFVEAHSDDDEIGVDASDNTPAVDQNMSCQAKIFISDERHRYFQSKDGQEYLCKILPEYELTGSIEKTIAAGYALFLTGLPRNQERFQLALLKKYGELNNARTEQQIDNKVPKNVKALIRFLRDSINQLHNNLGSATDLYKRLNDTLKLQSKVGAKSADRIRRTLNMIFLGQAGLQDGDAHFEVLLQALRTLLNNYDSNGRAPKELREKINASWRLLFTSYDHKCYAYLLTTYIKLPPIKRNRIRALKLDANILGDSVLDVTLSKEQKDRLNDSTKKQLQQQVVVKKESELSKQAPTTTAAESKLILNVVVPEQQQQLHGPTITADTLQTLKPSNSQTNETTTDLLDHSFSKNLLKSIEDSLSAQVTISGARNNASKMASRFWSCKSQEYLLEIIELAKTLKSSHLDRLERLYKQASEGKFSFVNHSDVLKIYSRTIKKYN